MRSAVPGSPRVFGSLVARTVTTEPAWGTFKMNSWLVLTFKVVTWAPPLVAPVEPNVSPDWNMVDEFTAIGWVDEPGVESQTSPAQPS